ncbi:hypothetical protein I6A84_32775 [Frankia sp. CNm7]|uniref:RiboL-PSP-HEPN domain-containing protein n=1 Tax=Frankia nepalensis TaxID=1836974 RepID=A0A937RDE2_9ACTN|nr:HEPN domain-containing protein [Frankia nepalensis]MBL7498640.1 hypothetical protein [Frankia nepalensis]MBL7509194.1 hypothetical protein [Frankia nepalensis]MBL7522732.1 hypothetical protein [Frankia nepalensis]MBL7628385.1 hypothetical protein [Frankia nepalensis]
MSTTRSPIDVWPPAEVTFILKRLSELASIVEEQARSSNDQEIVSWLARLLVIRSCGYLEQTVAETARAYTRHKSYGLVRSFSLGWLERTHNPTPDALETFTGRFDAGMQEELGEFLNANDEELRRELAFLVDRRNRIAHGLNEGIGVVKALALKDVACQVADWFILRFRPT